MGIPGKSKMRGDESAAHSLQAFQATLKREDRYFIYNFTIKFRSRNHAACFLCSAIPHSTFHHQPAKTGLSIVWKSKIS